MKRLDRYLLRESLPPLIFGLLLYSTLAVISVTLPRLGWIVGAPLGPLLGWLALQVPAAAVQTLPIALLLAVLLTFGRLSADSELLAAQAGGVALGRLSRVFILLGLFAAAGALFLNERVLPATNARVGALYWELTSGGSGLYRLAEQNLPLGDMSLRFGSTDRATDEIFGVRLESWQDRTLTVVFADRARFVDGGLELYGYQTTVLDFAALSRPQEDAETFLRALLRASSRAPGPDSSLRVTLPVSYDDLVTRFGGGGFEDSRSVWGAYEDARDRALPLNERRTAAALFHRKLAEPFANLTLLLVAVPLALLYARSRAVAFGLSLVVTLAWYLLLTVGQLLAQAGALPVWLGVWAGNGLLAGLGVYLLGARVNLR